MDNRPVNVFGAFCDYKSQAPTNAQNQQSSRTVELRLPSVLEVTEPLVDSNGNEVVIPAGSIIENWIVRRGDGQSNFKVLLGYLNPSVAARKNPDDLELLKEYASRVTDSENGLTNASFGLSKSVVLSDSKSTHEDSIISETFDLIPCITALEGDLRGNDLVFIIKYSFTQ